MTDTVVALAFAAPRTVELLRVPGPQAGPGACVVEIAYVGICGTDLALYAGDSTYLTSGLTSYPVRFGHEWSGVVRTVGEGVDALRPGDRVAGHNFSVCGACPPCRAGRRWLCLHHEEAGVRGAMPGMAATEAVMPASAMVVLPDGVSLLQGACAEPATCVMRSLAACRVAPDDRVVVIGTGMLGLAGLQLVRAHGARVDVVGVESGGLELARELGADRALAPEEAPHDAYDVVIEASGAPPAVALAPRLAAPGGRIGLVGVAHAPVDGFPAGDVVLKDLELHGTIGGLDQWDRVLDLAACGALDLDALVEEVVPYADAAAALARLAAGTRTRPKLLLRFGG